MIAGFIFYKRSFVLIIRSCIDREKIFSNRFKVVFFAILRIIVNILFYYSFLTYFSKSRALKLLNIFIKVM